MLCVEAVNILVFNNTTLQSTLNLSMWREHAFMGGISVDKKPTVTEATLCNVIISTNPHTQNLSSGKKQCNNKQ